MAKHNSVVGLEISEDYILVSDIHKNDDGTIHLNSVKNVTIPPRVVVNGVVSDPDTLAELIEKVFEDNNISTSNILVCMDDDRFIKRVNRLMVSTTTDLRAQIDELIGTSFIFKSFRRNCVRLSASSKNR